VVARLGPGSLAGEMGLVDHRLRNARLTTAEPVRVLAWTSGDFARLRADLPDFEAHVQRVTRSRHDENAQRSQRS
jgi:CRP-like cAMP-binding protein